MGKGTLWAVGDWGMGDLIGALEYTGGLATERSATGVVETLGKGRFYGLWGIGEWEI